jgi:aconitate hydratase
MAFDIEMIKEVYERMANRIDTARKVVGTPLTLAEKILYNHLWEGAANKPFKRGEDYVDFAPGQNCLPGCDGTNGPVAVYAGGKKEGRSSNHRCIVII